VLTAQAVGAVTARLWRPRSNRKIAVRRRFAEYSISTTLVCVVAAGDDFLG
jgi:hypothetical protein